MENKQEFENIIAGTTRCPSNVLEIAGWMGYVDIVDNQLCSQETLTSLLRCSYLQIYLPTFYSQKITRDDLPLTISNNEANYLPSIDNAPPSPSLDLYTADPYNSLASTRRGSERTTQTAAQSVEHAL